MKDLILKIVLVPIFFTLSVSHANATSEGKAEEDSFKVSIEKYEFGYSTNEEEQKDSKPVNQDPLSTPGAAVRLIYFDQPTNPNRAALQQGAAPTPGTYCLATNGNLGTLGLVPPDWSDGSDTPYNTPQGTIGCIPLTPTELADAGLELTEENGQPVLRTTRITLTTHDFNTFPIQAATPHQERAPHTLKNYNTNFWANPNPQEFTQTINGQNVTLKATPISYTYHYGDGTTLGPVTYPGYQLGEHIWDEETPTSHRYEQTGEYWFTLVTEYRGEYSVNGGPWQVIEGTVQRTSEPQLVNVWRVKVGLVADDCAANPEAWGCGSS
ncbi:hypothetical protein [Rothia nasimurium]|uniref:hypothetical protein n=1 Tax=Rothia nasimurium TaxID=85336 RepID=UPI001F33F172|nr:hypothetical protein [Rothia nasimurium]